MKFGVADFGMNVWDGGCFDIEERLRLLKEIGYEGVERLTPVTAADAVNNAARFHRLGMDYATVLGPTVEVSIQWTAAFQKSYVWTSVSGKDFDTFCRQVNHQAEACERWGINVALHNHLGTLVESQQQLEDFLERCPDCGLILDTAHLAAADGDSVEIVRKYADRLTSIHLKDWLLTNPDIGLDQWYVRGRFCELGAGNIGLDNAAVMRELVNVGYDGWIFVEQDTHLQDPFKDLAISRQYLRDAGF
ncbi:MAG: sugar phosphate isomerase/epimerase [Planctomycetes bacterium]|nr:sugar phosphate isomerase/epimerase [Planctomycetota bacterium]